MSSCIRTRFHHTRRHQVNSGSTRRPSTTTQRLGRRRSARRLYERRLLLFMIALWNMADHHIIALWFLLSFFFFSSPNLSRRRLDVCHTSTHRVALVQISDGGLKHAAHGSLQIQDAKNSHLRTIAQLCRCLAISLQLRHVSTIGKKLLSSNISSRCPHNMVDYGPLAGEIGPVVWGILANFNGFRVLAALLHGTPVVGVSETLRR